MSITITNSSVFFDKNDIVSSDGLTHSMEGFRTVIAGDLSPFKNRIINGDMSIDQRNEGNSVTASSSTSPFIVDRFRLYNNSATSYLRGQRVNAYADDTPEGHQSYIRITTLASGYNSSGNSDNFGVMTLIEGYDFYDLFYGSINAVPAILSFWARSSITGEFSVSFRNNNTTRSLVQRFSIPTGNQWRKIYIFVPPCGDGAWDVTTGVGLRISWNLGVGSVTYPADANRVSSWLEGEYLGIAGQTNLMSSATGTTFDLTGVQFERCTAPTFPCWILRNTQVSANGTTGLTSLSVPNGDLDDGSINTPTLPFNIDFFGNTYSTLTVSSNGFIGFRSSSELSSFTTIPVVLTSIGSLPHIGFFKGDKRLTALWVGIRTGMLGNSLSNVYIVRWEGYNYGGVGSNKTIVEIWFYQNKLEGNTIIDVVYVQNQNTSGGTVPANIELYSSNGNGVSTYPLQFMVNLNILATSYRIVIPPPKAVMPAATTDNYYWNSSAVSHDHSINLANLVDNEVYTRIGASTYTFTSKPIELLKCQRYYQKTYSEGTVPGTASASGGLYPYFRDGTASAVQRYVPYAFSGDMRVIPSGVVYDYAGASGKASSDGVNGYSAALSGIGTSMAFVYFTGSMPSHYSLYAWVTLDAELA